MRMRLSRFSSVFILIFRTVALPYDLIPDPAARAVEQEQGRGPRHKPYSDLVNSGLHPESGYLREMFVERRHAVPEIWLGASDAGVAAADGPAGAVVPSHLRTVVEGRWALVSSEVVGRNLRPDRTDSSRFEQRPSKS